MKLFLDDERDPVQDDFIVIRSFEEARDLIWKKGIPEFISFDHDLGSSLTGYDLAKFIVALDIVTREMPANFSFYVHSQNCVGAEMIRSLLDNYLANRSSMSEMIRVTV